MFLFNYLTEQTKLKVCQGFVCAGKREEMCNIVEL